MRVKTTKQHDLRAAARHTKMLAWRQVFAGLAILGLYVQLIAAGLCAASSATGADLTDFPICHTDISSGKTPVPSGDHAPASQHSCPFCAIHCHVVIVLAPAIMALAIGAVVATPQRRGVVVTLTFTRFFASAAPRGPPVLA